jgi:hypothetical protein
MLGIRVMNRFYYYVKPFIPRIIQIWIRGFIVRQKRRKYIDVWPIIKSADKPLTNLLSWPYGKQFALILTHDVETAKGQKRCNRMMDLEKQMGFRSSFNFVPERYDVSPKLRNILVNNGFEVGVHGLNHDGRLFRSQKIFQERAYKINRYLKEWNELVFVPHQCIKILNGSMT